MSFGIGINAQRTNAGRLTGRQVEVACKCWFTSTGHMIPLSLKFQDEEEMLHTIDQVQVHSYEEKYYAGVPSVEYDTTLTYQGVGKRVKLIFFKEECRWVLLLEEREGEAGS